MTMIWSSLMTSNMGINLPRTSPIYLTFHWTERRTCKGKSEKWGTTITVDSTTSNQMTMTAMKMALTRYRLPSKARPPKIATNSINKSHIILPEKTSWRIRLVRRKRSSRSPQRDSETCIKRLASQRSSHRTSKQHSITIRSRTTITLMTLNLSPTLMTPFKIRKGCYLIRLTSHLSGTPLWN